MNLCRFFHFWRSKCDCWKLWRPQKSPKIDFVNFFLQFIQMFLKIPSKLFAKPLGLQSKSFWKVIGIKLRWWSAKMWLWKLRWSQKSLKTLFVVWQINFDGFFLNFCQLNPILMDFSGDFLSFPSVQLNSDVFFRQFFWNFANFPQNS